MGYQKDVPPVSLIDPYVKGASVYMVRKAESRTPPGGHGPQHKTLTVISQVLIFRLFIL